jgi:hypothetical protein
MFEAMTVLNRINYPLNDSIVPPFSKTLNPRPSASAQAKEILTIP